MADVGNEDVYLMFYISSIAFTLVCVLAFVLPQRVQAILSKPVPTFFGGVVAGIGCVLLFAACYFNPGLFLDRPQGYALFVLGSLLTGAGTGSICLRCGLLYCRLTPRRVLVYTAAAHLLTTLIYFVLLAVPERVFGEGISWVIVTVFILLPIVAGALVALPVPTFLEKEALGSTYRKGGGESSSAESGLWKLALALFVFLVISRLARIDIELSSSLWDFQQSDSLSLLLLLLFSVSVLLLGLVPNTVKFNYGKTHVLFVIVLAIMVAMIPVIDPRNLIWASLMAFVERVLKFVVHCLLCFIGFGGRVHPIKVFGLGYGVFMLGDMAGMVLGSSLMPEVIASQSTSLFFLAMTGISLLVGLLLFTEKDVKDLLFADEEEEAFFETYFTRQDDELVDKGKGDRFKKVIREIAEDYSLSDREAEVLQYLAMGYSKEAIAKRLSISQNTVRSHSRSVYVKIGVHTRQDVIRLVETYEPRAR